MSDVHRLAVIGGSIESIAGYPHMVAAQMDHRFEVVTGAFSRQAAVNQASRDAWRIQRLYDDWHDLLRSEQGQVDAVVILLPTPMHAECLAAVRAAGLPIICEKPLVTDLREMADFSADFDQQREFVVVTNNYSGYPMVRELRERLRQGEFGAVHGIRIEMPQESFLRPPKSIKYPQPWRLTDGEVPMISLDLGTHCYHLADFLIGERPDRVWSDMSRISRYGVVDDLIIRYRYPSGISGD
ncbi:MAG: Gfo/Idh/MocA family protein, partial [Planctomycetota bacterium]